jgi:hypothetical protein
MKDYKSYYIFRDYKSYYIVTKTKMEDFETFKSKKNRGSNRKQKFGESREFDESRHDFMAMFSDIFNSINYKVAFFLFLLGIFLFSDIFVENFLTTFKGAVYADSPTTSGTTIQLVFLTIGYIILDLLVVGKVI